MAPGRRRKDSAQNPAMSTTSESSEGSGGQMSPNSGADPTYPQQQLTCACPTGCIVGETIDPQEPEDAVRVLCSNSECTEGCWVHSVCFNGWEQQMLTVLRNSGRARTWPEKQRLANLWTKRGYDITYKACECRCGGHMRKDSSYTPPSDTIEEETETGTGKANRRQRRRTNSKQLPSIGRPHNSGGGYQLTYSSACSGPPRLRSRTLSLGSVAGINAHNDAGGMNRSPPQAYSYGSRTRDRPRSENHENFFADSQVQTTGSIFQRRDSMSSFYKYLPRWKVNGMHIKMEDDCPQGNDDTRIFLLTTLGDHKMREVVCLLCRTQLPIYDHYPLLDGTLFLSPVNHCTLGVPVRYENRDSFLLAVCVECLETVSPRLICTKCGNRKWFPGDRLMLGSLYTFDIISAAPCCSPECRQCNQPLPLPDPSLEQHRHFSAFSEASNCLKCGARDTHYIRRMENLVVLPVEIEEKTQILQQLAVA